jgi:simple sugar transport system ATP-binding protein
MSAKAAGQLAMKDISIAFPGVQALSHVDFEAAAGRAHALIGANGAGKSTLMKVLSGAHDHYSGEIFLAGQAVSIRNPKNAKDNGIGIVYQEVDTALIPSLSVGENIMLEQTVHGMKGKHLMNWRKLHREAEAVLSRMKVSISTRRLVQELTLAEKQLVLIARSITRECRFLVLDEPTAPLSRTETQRLFDLVTLLKSEGVGIIFISHRLPELYAICEDITIMRDGKVVLSDRIANVEQHEVVEYMLGTKLDGQFPERSGSIGKIAFEAKGMKDPGKIDDVTLNIRRGEIVGIGGLVGAGKTELCRALFGASESATGERFLDGKLLDCRTPYHAVRSGIALVPEERRREGILVEESVAANLTAASLKQYTRFGLWISRHKEYAAAAERIAALGIKAPGPDTKVNHLSGGNQQKVAIGKWLLVDAEVYIFDEPTKGVDVGAKRDIYELVAELAARGKCVLYASSEFPELMGLTNRIYVMYDGKIAKELLTEQTNEEEILLYSTGGLVKS